VTNRDVTTGVPTAPPRRVSRRTVVTRIAVAAGALVTVLAGTAVADADRADDGRPLFTRLLGTAGPVIAFLPGIGATTRYWALVVGPLADRARLLLVDLLGFGRSPKPWTTYSVERHVAELHRVLAPATRDGPITLVGHSLGARLAVAYATRHPDDVARLVVISMPYFGGEERAKRFIRGRTADGWLWTHMIPFALACLLGRRLLGWAAPWLAGDVPRAVAEDLNQMTWRSSTSTMWEVIYRHDLAADVAALPPSMPMLCLHGDADESAPLDRMRALQTLHPTCVIRVYPGADHQLPLRHPAWVREQVAADVGA
jgi:pimeloyl-ACP methyl ester carboxylesterase